MKTTTSFLLNADRYLFDFGECSFERGWAQLDSGQDASYFGTWANPFTLRITNFAEGDVTRQACADAEEFRSAIRAIAAWNAERGSRLAIDPVLDAAIESRFRELGLGDLLH